jgi:hypothetical protein
LKGNPDRGDCSSAHLNTLPNLGLDFHP